MSIKIKKNHLIPESKKTQKAREKLQKELQRMEKIATQEALKKKSREIHDWIGRRASMRVPLKKKNISLFDENQTSASCSTRIFRISQEVQQQMKRFPLSTSSILLQEKEE